MKNEEHGLSRELSPEITGGEGNPTLPISEAEVFRLPEWNDLSNAQRIAICDEGERWAFDEILERDAAHAIYGVIRKHVHVAPPPLMVHFARGSSALVAEEQVAGSWSREANETDWKARCEAAEQALEGMRTEVTAKLTAAESLMLASGWWFNKAGYMTDAALWIEQALLALNPTPQGGKPDSEPRHEPAHRPGDDQMKIWAKTDGAVREGKYLVVRRDGTIPAWAHFVMASGDPAAPAGLRAYAAEARRLGMDPEYCQSIADLADDFDRATVQRASDAAALGVKGADPDQGPHRQDNPAVIRMMRHEADLSEYRDE